jgi:hypothetical protein
MTYGFKVKWESGVDGAINKANVIETVFLRYWRTDKWRYVLALQ